MYVSNILSASNVCCIQVFRIASVSCLTCMFKESWGTAWVRGMERNEPGAREWGTLGPAVGVRGAPRILRTGAVGCACGALRGGRGRGCVGVRMRASVRMSGRALPKSKPNTGLVTFFCICFIFFTSTLSLSHCTELFLRPFFLMLGVKSIQVRIYNLISCADPKKKWQLVETCMCQRILPQFLHTGDRRSEVLIAAQCQQW